MSETFQILCITMGQKDFSKLQEMNIHSDVFFANQADRTEFCCIEHQGKRARMLTTATRGIGCNRNFCLQYADADICLLADDDVRYVDDVEERVLAEFAAYPQADIMIFHLESTDPLRLQQRYAQTSRCFRFGSLPWGACRVAFRLQSIRRTNVCFSHLFGASIFPSGEDSLWLSDVRRKGLSIYTSKETIGSIDLSHSTWFTGFNEQYFYGKGAFYKARNPLCNWLFRLYVAFVAGKKSSLSFKERWAWMARGVDGYQHMKSFKDWQERR